MKAPFLSLASIALFCTIFLLGFSTEKNINSTPANLETVQPEIWYVDSSAMAPNDGTSWGTAFNDLQDAIDAASVGDEIWVAKGSYLPTKDQLGDPNPTDITKRTFFINKDLNIYGGFNGTETQLNERDWETNETILSGDGIYNNVIKIRPEQSDSNKIILDGFTISNGYDASFFNGAGIQITTTNIADYTFQISNCRIINNESLNFGGGIYFQPSNVTGNKLVLENCEIELNHSKRGGALYALSEPPSFTFDTKITEITNCSFENNSAVWGGGAINLDGTELISKDNFFKNNSLTTTSIQNEENLGGGAINLINVFSAEILRDTFEDNKAIIPSGDGGAISSTVSNILIGDCKFKGNISGNKGGAVNILAGIIPPTFTGLSGYRIENSEFLNNGSEAETLFGGAVSITGVGMGISSLISNVFRENKSGNSGGALYFDIIQADANQSPVISDCLFEENIAAGGSAIYTSSTLPNVKECVFKYESIQSFGSIFLDFNECTFINNSFIFAISADVNLEKCSFINDEEFSIYSKELAANNCLFVNTVLNVVDFSLLSNSTFYADTLSSPLLTFDPIINTASTYIIRNSILWRADSGSVIDTINYSASNCIVSENIQGDDIIDIAPQFVNPSDNDFNLQLCSPGVNAGSNTDVIPNSDDSDLGNALRITGGIVDIGAFENQEAESEITHYFVKADSSANDQNRGISWDCPLATIQQAIDIASTGDTIWVSKGTYTPTKDIAGDTKAREKTIFIDKDLKIYGGFDGTENPDNFDLDDRNFSANETILSGIDENGEVSYHVVYAEILSEETIFDGFTISDGLADGTTGQKRGGGFYNINSSAQIRNCRFENNAAVEGGGAFATFGNGIPTLQNCFFQHNISLNNGGALYLEGNSKILDCSFSENTSSESGGAISVQNDALIKRCDFTNNSGNASGGAIHISGSPEIFNCIFDNNDADNGGGIYNANGDLTVANCLFRNSNAFKGAGIFHEGFSNSSKIINCTFSENSSPGSNGILHTSNGDGVLVVNSIFYGNNGTSIVDENNDTWVRNSIVENGCNEGGIVNCDGIENMDANPLFDSEFKLQAGSPAIDAGFNSGINYTGEINEVDLAEISRIVNGTVDLGAYEFCDPASGANCDIINFVNESTSEKLHLQLFPNPANDFLNLSFENSIPSSAEASIFSMSGISLKKFDLKKGQLEYSLNISDLNSGFYFLKIEIGNYSSYEKFVVK